LYLIMVGMVGLSMAMLSLIIAPVQHPWAGLASYLFWIFAPWLSCMLVKQMQRPKTYSTTVAMSTAIAWILASTLQVVLGHFLWEQNSPDVLNSNQHVSWLSFTHSVQIAWSSTR